MNTIFEFMVWVYSFVMGYIVKLGFVVADYMGASENLFVIIVCFVIIVKLAAAGLAWTLTWIGLSIPVVLLAMVFQAEDPEVRMMNEAQYGVTVTKGLARISRIAGRDWEAEKQLPVLERQMIGLEGMVKGQVRVRHYVQELLQRGEIDKERALQAKAEWRKANRDLGEFQIEDEFFSKVRRSELHSACTKAVDSASRSWRPIHALERLITQESLGFTSHCSEEVVHYWVDHYLKIMLNEETPPEMFFVLGWGDVEAFR